MAFPLENHQQKSNRNVCIPNFTDTNIVHSTIQSQRYVGIIFTNRLVESGCGLYTTCDTFETLNLIIFAQTSEKNTERERRRKRQQQQHEKRARVREMTWMNLNEEYIGAHSNRFNSWCFYYFSFVAQPNGIHARG